MNFLHVDELYPCARLLMERFLSLGDKQYEPNSQGIRFSSRAPIERHG